MLRLFFVILFIYSAYSFDRKQFEDPNSTDFYVTNSNLHLNESHFELLSNVTVHTSFIEGIILNTENNLTLKYKILFYLHDIIRFIALEETSSYVRKEVDGVLIDQLEEMAIKTQKSDDQLLIICSTHKLRIIFSKFLFELLDEHDSVIMEVKRHNLFNFESIPPDHVGARGPRSVGLEFSFKNSKAVYVLPERALSLRLPMTRFLSFLFFVLFYLNFSLLLFYNSQRCERFYIRAYSLVQCRCEYL